MRRSGRVGFFGRLLAGGRPIVSVVRLTGPIGVGGRFRPSIGFSAIVGQIHEAFSVPGLKAVALVINSPGGSPVQSALIMKRVRDLAEEKDVPVLAFTEDVAASGGYMLALAGDEIFVHEASIVGSIGVLSASFGLAGAIDRLGIERRLYTSGESKARLDPFLPEKSEDVAWLKDLQSQIHDYFKAMVKERRGRRLGSDTPDLFSGDVWLGQRAVELGLADGIGDARTVLRQRFGKKVRFRAVAPKKGLLANLFTRPRADDAFLEPETSGFASDLLAAIEARLMWNRFGL